MSKVPPVSKVGQFFGNHEEFGELIQPQKNCLDVKIQEIVLAQIKSSKESPLTTALFPCSIDWIPAIVNAPSIVYGALSGLIHFEEIEKCPSDGEGSSDGQHLTARRIFYRKPSRKKRRNGRDLYPQCRKRQVPIGLPACNAYASLNALMQFVLFVPGFREAFLFAPQSAQPIVDFIDQYMLDQEQKELISKADSNRLIQLFFHKLPSYFLNKSLELNMAGFLFDLVQAIFGQTSDRVCESIAFHSEWHVQWNLISSSFAQATDLPMRPPELLLSVYPPERFLSPLSIQRQFFIPPIVDASEQARPVSRALGERKMGSKGGVEGSHCYDLDAFIEWQEGVWAVYLKTKDGIWYRCIDSNVVAMRSTNLKVPLARSVLLHYTRIWPS